MDDADKASQDMAVTEEVRAAEYRARRAMEEACVPASHCGECGDPIPVARQELVPCSPYCADCAAWLEARR